MQGGTFGPINCRPFSQVLEIFFRRLVWCRWIKRTDRISLSSSLFLKHWFSDSEKKFVLLVFKKNLASEYGIDWVRGLSHVLCIGRQTLNHCATREAQEPILIWREYSISVWRKMSKINKPLFKLQKLEDLFQTHCNLWGRESSKTKLRTQLWEMKLFNEPYPTYKIEVI